LLAFLGNRQSVEFALLRSGPRGHALYCLSAALDYIEATPLDGIEIRTGYLARLTAHELEQERRLKDEVNRFYWSTRARQGLAETDSEALRLLGAFESSWTLAPRDLEAARNVS
jgi:hypothetical protein